MLRRQLTPRQAILVGGAMVTVSGFAIELYTPALPSLVGAFAADASLIKLSVTLYLLGFALAQLVVGSLSDAIGRRPVAIGFLALFLGASALAAVAPNVDVLLAARLLQGVGSAVTQTVARAVVRDCFAGKAAARVMNAISVALAISPLVAPTLGGAVVEAFGWYAPFLLMAAHGAAVLALVAAILPETAPATDLARLRPWSILRDYLTVARDPRFARLALLNGFVLGTLYAGPSMLPFVLIGRIGLTPVRFGLAMLAVGGGYVAGTQLFRLLLSHFALRRILMLGLGLALFGGALLPVSLALFPPTVLGVMAPVGIIALSSALLLPIAATEALQPFPDKAGAASALIGFAQIGCGLLGSLVAIAIGEPVLSLALVYPGMALAGALSHWLLGRRVRVRAE